MLTSQGLPHLGTVIHLIHSFQSKVKVNTYFSSVIQLEDAIFFSECATFLKNCL